MAPAIRTEHDSLGARDLPTEVLYGINTLRAIENFPVSGRQLKDSSSLVSAMATIKEAAALANAEVGALSRKRAELIARASQQMREGSYREYLLVDLLEGSGGTSLHMNVNEVLANAALVLEGRRPGDYAFIHPNDDVNLSQSTNDVLPTAIKLAAHRECEKVVASLITLSDALGGKASEFRQVLRLGRTCLMDAQPMTLGQAFGGYEMALRRHAAQLSERGKELLVVPLGGTAIGTGFGNPPGFKLAVIQALQQLTREDIRAPEDYFDAMQNMDACARLSAELRCTANTLWKIANDLILLSSGPAGGIGELHLPAVQAGSSIMPGKVNPVIPITICQAAMAVFGNDAAVNFGAQQGLLEINHYELLIADRLLDSLQLLQNVTGTFRERCIVSIAPDEPRMWDNLMNSSALATALVPTLGYATVAELVRAAEEQGRSFVGLLHAQGYLNDVDIRTVLDRAALAPTAWASVLQARDPNT